ncbi:SGNH/GDSL hydrolase family protein [Neobacillus sp. SM06]|uniref:SGNH/GDSL hydrolase family protein n=1 Tax=Neobacillus sp. SM06 TaxID=3422492 RepID=UPI003D2D0F63
MKKTFTLLIALTFLLSSCSQAGPFQLHAEKKAAAKEYRPIPADFFPRKLTVVSAGDSLTEGVGDSTNQGGYLPYLKKMLEKDKWVKEAHFYNYGVKGNQTTDLLKRLQSPTLSGAIKKADMVILTIGGNDIMQVVRDNISNLQISAFTKEKEVYISHLTRIFDIILAENPHASIVLVGLYNPFEKWFSNVEEMNQIVDDWNKAGQTVVANYSNAYFVSIEDLFIKTNENLLYTDNFHPNDKGYKLIAQRLHESLEERAIPDLEKRSYMVIKEGNF